MREKYYVMYQENENALKFFTTKKSLIFSIQFIICLLFVTNYMSLTYLCTEYEPVRFMFMEACSVFILTELVTVLFIVTLVIKKATPILASMFLIFSIGGALDLLKTASVAMAISIGGADIWLLVYLTAFILFFGIFMLIRIMLRYREGYYKKQPDREIMDHLRVKVITWSVLAVPFIPFTFYYFRTRGINEIGGKVSSALMVYASIYLFTVIIFTFLARHIVFVFLETRTLLRKRKCSGISE